MFGFANIPFSSHESTYYFKSYFLTFVIAGVGATPLIKQLIIKVKENHTGERMLKVIEPFSYLIILLIVTGYLVDSSFNPFLYFRF
jgi:alginate O-acetyltransferase complex protein AlgI